jgi:cellulose synthase/poly-beta-1,6-N-acetylglucosamine synthase-like glycosyltransferase
MFDEFFATALVINVLGLIGTAGVLIARRRPTTPTPGWDAAATGVVATVAAVGTLLDRGPNPWSAGFVVVGAVALVAVRRRWPSLHLPGVLALVVQGSMLGVATIWVVHYALTVDVGATTRTLLLAGITVRLLDLPSGLVASFLALQVMFRDEWRRPNRPHRPPQVDGPMVSIHVPCYAEPPDVVIATLDALADLRYTNYEVLVVDNNTKDPALWQPVAAHCETLGSRFRFFHVDPLTGAKGGALNFALAHTHPNAELVALVDADYQMLPDFLASLVGHFDDPELGFVQCRYDFRGWPGRRFQTGCYWGYRAEFPMIYRSANDHVAVIPMGTCCIFRRRAIVEAGGWSEWCVSEDAEIGVRIHARGYTSFNFDETFGYGLIPETFRDFKKQRFRWNYGPVQLLKRHWRLFLPGRLATPSRLSSGQKLVHLVHSGAKLANVLRILALAPVGLGLLASMVVYDERPPLPTAMWFALIVGSTAYCTAGWTVFRRVVGVPARDLVAFAVVHAGLGYMYISAIMAAILTRTTVWRRTNKFKAHTSGWRVLTSVPAELTLTVVTATVAVGAFLVDHSGLFLLLELAALRRSLLYGAAVATAVQADRELRRSAAAEPSRVQVVPPRSVRVATTNPADVVF